MDITNYNVKDTIKCECKHEFDIHEINGLLPIDNHGFYSNIVKTCSKVYCPKCNKETLLLLKQKGQTWEILGIATKKEDESKLIRQELIENKEEKDTKQEFICPVCQKVCKNKLGLNAHIKTHNKQDI
jgi:hypothetical protein